MAPKLRPMNTSLSPERTAVRPAPCGPVVHRWWRDVSALAGWSVLLVVVSLWVSDGGVHDLAGSWDTALTSSGRLLGLIASALMLLQIFLMARVPWVEKAWGQQNLTRLHGVVGFTSFAAMMGHIVLVTAGYAAADPSRIVPTAVDLVLNYPGMVLAVLGTAALIMVVVTSMRVARRRLRYESWHLLHLYAYLGTGLALPHQLWSGQSFQQSTTATVFWWGLYILCAGTVLVYRIGLPAWTSLRSPIRVIGVHRESESVVSVTVGGPGVARLDAHGGQYFQWRFLDGPGCSRAHPYSLSATPDGTTLRFTAAIVGDGSSRLTQLRPGTRVLVEGPYGHIHAGARTQPKTLLIGAGIGITPMRALIEDLSTSPGDVMVINRARTRADAVLHDELVDITHRLGAGYAVVDGHRIPGRDSWLPVHAARWSDTHVLARLCPDVADRDVFVCGPPEWAAAVRRAASALGTPPRQIHTENF